jgi:glyoxylase-like metal-dependent hydrolase (beta-lactamase superfamily II)
MTLQMHLLDTGSCLAREGLVLRGAGRAPLHMCGLVALLHHPREGWMLFDTGYAPRLLDLLERWPYSLYRRTVPTTAPQEMAVVSQLASYGLAASDIRCVVVSHFHVDHIAGLADFPHARIVATRQAIESIAGRTGIAAMTRGFAPELLPADFCQRLDVLPEFRGADVPHLGRSHDVFGDGSVAAVHLPGHAAGQMGALVETDRGRVLLAADGCWHSRAYLENVAPHPLVVRLMFDNAKQTVQTVERLHQFHRAHPDVSIVPTHCPDVAARVRRP